MCLASGSAKSVSSQLRRRCDDVYLLGHLAHLHPDLGSAGVDHVEEVFALLSPLGDLAADLLDVSVHACPGEKRISDELSGHDYGTRPKSLQAKLKKRRP